MSRYQKYQAYKDSGVEWIGEIPEHWETTKIRFYYDVQLGKMLQPESKNESDFEVKYLKAQHVQWNQINLDDLPTMWATEREIEKFSVQQGDLLICEGGEVGRSALLDEKIDVCIIQNALHRVRAKEKSCVKYLQYFMQHVSNALWFDILCNKATIAHLTGEKLAALDFPLPPLEEQQAITYFLDRKTAQIDELIAKKEALLKKLDEKRTAIITQAVTKGLDPSVPMKDSGVEWIGEIPKHWEVKRLKHLLSEPLKYGANETAEETNPEYPRYIRITDIHEDGSLNEETFRSLPHEIAENYLLNDGDILFARSGATVGKTFIYNNTWGNAAFAGYLIRARVNRLISASFLYIYLQSNAYWHWISSVIIQATIQNVSAEKYAILFIPYPPFEEQLTIFEYIENNTAKIDHQKKQITKAIERLMEYRTALITNSATGKNNIESFYY